MLPVVKCFLHYFWRFDLHALTELRVLMLFTSHYFLRATKLKRNCLLFIVWASYFNERSIFMNVRRCSMVLCRIWWSLVANYFQKTVVLLDYWRTIFSVVSFLEKINWAVFRLRDWFLVVLLLTDCGLLNFGARRRWSVILKVTLFRVYWVERRYEWRFSRILVLFILTFTL